MHEMRVCARFVPSFLGKIDTVKEQKEILGPR